MKRILIILSILCLFTCGCENKKNDENKVTSSSTTMSTTTTKSTTSSNQTTSESKTTTSTKQEKMTTTNKTTKKQTTACRSKKFNKKYSYAYKTKDECMKQGNLAFLDISDNVNKEVFAYDCTLIKDECGVEWYGVHFYVYNRNTSKEEIFYY